MNNSASQVAAKQQSPWSWIPTLYFAEGLPYIIIMSLSVVMYKRLGISNTDIALYTSWLYLPWVIKPFWSPIVDILGTKRHWIIGTQLLIGAGLGGVAFTIPMDAFFQTSLAIFWLLAFSSATHDIAADGFYMLALSKHRQTWFVGIRSTFYRFAVIAGQGLLIMLAGYIESSSGLAPIEYQVRAVTTSETSQQSTRPSFVNDGLAIQISPTELVISTDSTFDTALANPNANLRSALNSAPNSNSSTNSAPNSSTNQSAKRAEIYGQTKVDQQHLAKVISWNETNGFVAKTKTKSSIAAETDTPDEGYIAQLEIFIKSNFGIKQVTEAGNKLEGNIGIAYIKLSQTLAEGETITATLSHSGNKNIKLIAGERLEFNYNNQHQAAMIAIQLDPRLSDAASATFTLRAGDIALAWSLTLFTASGLFLMLFAYHFLALPKPDQDHAADNTSFTAILKNLVEVFVSFFAKKHMISILAFLLFYRFSEAQLVKLAAPFLLDSGQIGGLQLTTGEVGFVYGTIGVLALTLGGLTGGFLAAQHGFRKWLWPMAIAINVPNIAYLLLAYTLPENLMLINIAVAIEQFGYGFGFTAYMLFMIYIADGEHKTAHFAIGTGFMALGMMIPGMFSGWLQELIGYQHFFIWVLIATTPSLLATAFIKVDPNFGKA